MENRTAGRDVAERSEAESRPAARPPLPPPGTPGKSYTAEQKAEALRAYAASGQMMRAWCASRGISTATLCAWRRAYAKGGVEGLAPRRNPRNSQRGRTHRPYSPEERRAALDAYKKSGMTQDAFSALWGISTSTLAYWRRAHRERGPRGLEAPCGGGRRGRKKVPVPEAVRAEIVATKLRFPAWGLRRVKDSLARFAGLRVGVNKVREVVREEGLETKKPKKKVRRAPPRVRRFERAKPRELWQSDITSYVLTRHSQRVYLTVFLDDHSRYIVSWSLALQQRSELVTECLLEGLARFGKPKEVLTDQGRQYFAWRGKSRFQKLLIREGIQHVVSRAHHPQTLGKCERLWKTVGDELWYRARPQDLDEARRRLGHFFDHYNHFRPHQGIDGLVPADRFFGAEKDAREAIEKRMDDNALRLALGEAPRRGVFLYGQIDGEAVSLHGERGRLVIERPGREKQEISMSALGAPGGNDDEGHEESDRHEQLRDTAGGSEAIARDRHAHEPCGQGAGDEGDHRLETQSRTGSEPDRSERKDADPPSTAHALQERPAPAGTGAGALGGLDDGAAGERPRERGLDLGVLAGEDLERGSGGASRRGAASGMADEPDGSGRDGVRTPAAAALEEGAERDAHRPGERPEGTAQGAGEDPPRARGGQAPDRHPEDAARECGARDRDTGGAACEREEGGEEGAQRVATSSAPRPPDGAPGEERRRERHGEGPDDSSLWWESAWGELFDSWEQGEERRR